jgi:hypothetical protein
MYKIKNPLKKLKNNELKSDNEKKPNENSNITQI